MGDGENISLFWSLRIKIKDSNKSICLHLRTLTPSAQKACGWSLAEWLTVVGRVSCHNTCPGAKRTAVVAAFQPLRPSSFRSCAFGIFLKSDGSVDRIALCEINSAPVHQTAVSHRPPRGFLRRVSAKSAEAQKKGSVSGLLNFF